MMHDEDELPRPLFDLILLRPEEHRITGGGIHVPENAKDNHWVVLAAGPGKFEFGAWVDNPVKAGDRVVLFNAEEKAATFLWGSKKVAIVSAKYVGCVLPKARDVLTPRSEADEVVMQ